MSCTTFNKVLRSEQNLKVVQTHVAHAPHRSPIARVEHARDGDSDKRETNSKPISVTGARKQLLARVLTSRRSLFQDARFLMDSQPKMHGARSKLQLCLHVVFLAVHRQNLKRQVCQIFMQAGHERNRREALKAATNNPIRMPTGQQAKKGQRESTVEEEPLKAKYSNSLAESIRNIMETRAWIHRARERKNDAIKQRSIVSELEEQSEKQKEKLNANLDRFIEAGHHIDDQLAIANALHAKFCGNEGKNEAAAAPASEERDAARNVAEEQKSAQQQARRRLQLADDLIRLAEEEHEQAIKAFENAKKRKAEVVKQLQLVRQVATVEDVPKMHWEETVTSDRSDTKFKNCFDSLLGAHPEKGSVACPSTGGACTNAASVARGGGGSCPDAAGDAVGVAASIAVGAATPVAGLAGDSSADAGVPTVGTGDLATVAADGRSSITSSHGLAMVSSAQSRGNHASSHNSTAPTAAGATVSNGSINLEVEDAGQRIVGTPAAVETLAAVGTPATFDCTETIAPHSGAGKVAQYTLVDGFAQESVAKGVSSTPTLGVADGNPPSCTPPCKANGIATDSTSNCKRPTTADDIADGNAPIRPTPSEANGIVAHGKSSHTPPIAADDIADGNAPICHPPSEANGIVAGRTSSNTPPTAADDIAYGSTPIRPPPSDANGLAINMSSSCTPAKTADGIADTSSSPKTPVTTDGMSSHKHTATADGAILLRVCTPLQQGSEEEASLDCLSTDTDLHLDTMASDSASDEKARGRLASNLSICGTTVSDSSTTDNLSSTDHHEGSGMQGVALAESDAGVALAESDAGCLGTPTQVLAAAPREARRSQRRTVAGRPNHRHLRAIGVASLEQIGCVLPAAVEEGHRAIMKPSHLDEAGNLELPNPPPTTLVTPPTSVGAEGSRMLSKLLHHEVYCPSETVEGDSLIRTRSRKHSIKIPGAMELTPNITGSQPQPATPTTPTTTTTTTATTTTATTTPSSTPSHPTPHTPYTRTPVFGFMGGSLTSRTSCMAANQSQQRISEGFANTARGAMEARTKAESVKAEDLSHRTSSTPSGAEMTTEDLTHRTLSKPSSSEVATEATEHQHQNLMSHRTFGNPSSTLLTTGVMAARTEACGLPGPVLESFPSSLALGPEGAEIAVAPLTAHRSPSRPPGVSGAMWAGRGTGSLSGQAPVQELPISVDRSSSSMHGDCKVGAAAQETLAEIAGIEELTGRSARRRLVSPECLDQVPLVSEGTDSPPRRRSKRANSMHAGTADFAGVQESQRQRRASKNTVMRKSLADHGALTKFATVECFAVADCVNIPNHPSRAPLASSPRRSSKAMIGENIIASSPRRSSKAMMGETTMPLNIVGQHVVQPKVLSSRSASKTDSSVLGGSSEAGTNTERRTGSKLASGEVLHRRLRAMTASPGIFKGYVEEALKAHEELPVADKRQHAAATYLTLNKVLAEQTTIPVQQR